MPNTDRPAKTVGSTKEELALLGAGGRWPVIDEVIDPRVVQQQSNLSCGPASAEMLLRDRGILNIDQAAIETLTGAPTSAEEIADVLNQLAITDKRWQGGWINTLTPSAAFDLLLKTNKSWMAQMKELGKNLAHMAIVDGIDEAGRVMIRDPWEGTSYKMEQEKFFKFWNQIAVF
ncbi:MAG: hypothetical protein GDA48_04180 [Hormoscilla sp. GM102CHS1]|nr:hypothetical protein [Hormoscilla sp. GM102CHS1]